MTETERLVCGSLGSFLRSIDRETPPMDARTKPIADIGLQTDHEVEWLCDLEEMGFRIPHRFRAFVTDDGTRMRTIGEIAKLIEPYRTSNLEVEEDERTK